MPVLSAVPSRRPRCARWYQAAPPVRPCCSPRETPNSL